MEDTTAAVLEKNIDKTIHRNNEVQRKPRGVAFYEYSHYWPTKNITFGMSIYRSIIKAFSAVFEYDGAPEELRMDITETFIVQSGRIKIIKVGRKLVPVHITPKKFNFYGDYIESTIVEPYMPKLSGKNTEIFKNVEFKNDVLGSSITLLIYPFINAIDEAMNNLVVNQEILAGKYIYTISGKQNTEDKINEEVRLSQWLTNGIPVKIIEKSLLDDGNLPLQKIETTDSSQSFIDTVQFNFNQMLNVLGIPNNNAEGKRERMIVPEIQIQNVMQSSIIDDMLKQRQRVVEEMNKTFGLNMSVKLRDNLDDVEGGIEEDDEQE